MPRTRHAQRCGILLVAVTGVIWIGFVASFSIHRLTPIPAWKQVFDIGAEQNVPTWWNSLLLAFVGIAMAVGAAVDLSADRRRRGAWMIGALAAFYLSLDEAAALHERLGAVADWLDVRSGTYSWVLPGLALAIVGCAVLFWSGRSLPAPLRHRLVLALGLYGLGALGFEALTGTLDNDTLFTLGIMIEEGLEMGACIVAVVAILDAFRIEPVANAIRVSLDDGST